MFFSFMVPALAPIFSYSQHVVFDRHYLELFEFFTMISQVISCSFNLHQCFFLGLPFCLVWSVRFELGLVTCIRDAFTASVWGMLLCDPFAILLKAEWESIRSLDSSLRIHKSLPSSVRPKLQNVNIGQVGILATINGTREGCHPNTTRNGCPRTCAQGDTSL